MSAKQGDREAGTLAGMPEERERRSGLRALGGVAVRIARPIVSRHVGGVLGRLKAEWPAVAGAELAATAWPEALGRDGALKLRVLPGAALELQHRAPLLAERINLYFGRTAVTRLVLRQGALPLASPALRQPPAGLSRPEQQDPLQQDLDMRLADIADPDLRQALRGLGHLLLAKGGGRD